MKRRTLERAVKFEDPVTKGTNRESRLSFKKLTKEPELNIVVLRVE